MKTVLNNISDGLFIIPSEFIRFYDKTTNQEVDNSISVEILKEYNEANFIRVNKELELAQTNNFRFRKYMEDIEDNIVWVEENSIV